MTAPVQTQIPGAGDDNFDALYLEHRFDAATEAALDEFAALEAELAAGKAATASDGTAIPPAGFANRPRLRVRRGVLFSPDESSGIIERGREMAGTVARELAVTPTQTFTRILPGGVIDAVNSTLDTVEDVAKFIASNISPDELKRVSESPLYKPRLPSPPEPTTALGQFQRETVEFLTAFIGPQKKLQGMRKAAGLTGKASDIAATELAGAVAAGVTFEKAESTLANLLAKHPEIAPDVNAYFATEEGEASLELEKRLESSLIGAGFGLATRGVVAAFRTLRSARIARARLNQAETAAAEEPLIQAADLEQGLGSEMGESLVRVAPAEAATPEAASLAQTRLAEAEARVAARFPTLSKEEIARQAALETTDVEVNLARINTTDDVRALIQQTTDLFKPSVSEARRGVRSQEATQEAADALGWSVSDVLSFRRGQGFNAEEAVAIRKLHASAAKSVMDLADAAAAPNAGPADHYRFRKAFAAFEAINETFLGARAEAGRALQSFNIRAADNAMSGNQLMQILDSFGGEAVSMDLAAAISRNRANLSPGQLSAMARKGALAATHDAVRESFTMGLLWNPGTHIVNAASPYIVAMQSIAERYGAEKMSLALGRQAAGESFVAPGEALVMAHGMMEGVKDLFSTVARDARASFSESSAESLAGRSAAAARGARESLRRQTAAAGLPQTNKMDARSGAISSQAFGANPASAIGKAVDAFGALTRTPGAGLGVEDDIGKMILYRTELHAQALRAATAKGGTPQEIAANYSRLLNEPTREVRMAAVDAAIAGTFTSDLGRIGKSFMKLREAVPLSFTVFPFIKTPANILMYNFERTPLAPISAKFRADLAAGGARADLATTKLILGTLTVGAFMDLAEMGYIHGAGPSASNKGLREAYDRSGIRPHSFDAGGVNYTINRFDPIGSQLSFGATMREHFRSYDYSEDDLHDLMKLTAALSIAAAESSTSKSWLMGVAQLVDLVRGSGSEGPGLDERALKYLAFQAGNFVPFSSAFRTARSLTDPTQPDVNPTMTQPIASVMESIEYQLPILEKRLPRRLTVWGDEIGFDEVYGRPADALLPTRMAKIEAEPIDAEIIKHRMDVRKIEKKTSFNGVMVNFREFPRVYEAYTKLAGNEARLPSTGKGVKDSLNEMVQGRGPLASIYAQMTDGPDGGKRGVISRVMSQGKTLAQHRILDEYGPYQDPEFDRFRDYWKRKNQESMSLRIGSGPVGVAP